MIGCALMYMIDQRLRQAKPESSHLPFGGMFVYLFGDIMQLPPVHDRAVYSDATTGSYYVSNEGFLAYRTFEHCQI